MFSWLAWDNSILTLDKLAARGCNRLPTATCVMCNAGIETVDHLFFSCPFATFIWNSLIPIFRLPSPPQSVHALWGSWRPKLSSHVRDAGDLIIRALMWNIWLERNARIFRDTYSACKSVLCKCIHMFLLWLNAVPDKKKPRLEDSAVSAKRSLDFLNDQPRSGEEDKAE